MARVPVLWFQRSVTIRTLAEQQALGSGREGGREVDLQGMWWRAQGQVWRVEHRLEPLVPPEAGKTSWWRDIGTGGLRALRAEVAESASPWTCETRSLPGLGSGFFGGSCGSGGMLLGFALAHLLHGGPTAVLLIESKKRQLLGWPQREELNLSEPEGCWTDGNKGHRRCHTRPHTSRYSSFFVHRKF